MRLSGVIATWLQVPEIPFVTRCSLIRGIDFQVQTGDIKSGFKEDLMRNLLGLSLIAILAVTGCTKKK